MRYQTKTNRSLSYLLKESLNPIDNRLYKENKENTNIINFPALKDKHPKDLRHHNMLEELKADKKVRSSTVVSVGSFLRKASVPEQLKRSYTQMVVDEYFDDLSKYLRASSAACQCEDMLLCHEITSSLRSKMIDWMIEVLSSYKMTEETFFKSVYIMDSYLKNNMAKLEVKDLHLIGITSMFIASKYQEIHPFKLEVLYDKIGRKKFRKSQILQCQSDIIQILSFEIENASVYDISRLASQRIKINMSEKSCRYFEKIILYLSKMVLFNSQLAGMSFHLLAGGVAFIGLKTLEQADSSMTSEDLLPELCNLLCLQMEDIIEVSRKVLDLAKNYSSYFPSLSNLKKFNKFQYQ